MDKKTLVLLILAFALLAGCKSELYARLSEKDANEIIAILVRNGIDSEKISGKKGEYAVHVDRSQIADAIQMLKEYSYPKEQFASMGDICKKEGLLSSPSEERCRIVFGLGQSVQDMLSRMDGVLTARVNVVIPGDDPFAESPSPSSAAVFIKYHPESNVSDYKSDIKMIVANGIEGLSYDRVSLMMVPAMTPPENTQPIPWERVFGIKLAADSVGVFWLLILSLALALLVALAGCGYLLWKLRRADAAADPAAGLQGESAPAAITGRPIDSLLKVVTG